MILILTAKWRIECLREHAILSEERVCPRRENSICGVSTRASRPLDASRKNKEKRLCQNTNAFLKINNPKLLNKKNYSDTGVNHRFSRKITQIRGTIDKKREKEAFVGVRRVKIDKNQLSLTGENQKSAKNGFPNIGKNKKCHWLHFPTLGKTKNPKSQIKDFRGSVHFDTPSFKFSNAY